MSTNVHTWTPLNRLPAKNLLFWIPLSWFAFIGFPIVVIKFLHFSKSFNPLSLVIVWAPLEFLLASINRQYHGHYNIQMLLTMQIIIACILYTLYLAAKHIFPQAKSQEPPKPSLRESERRPVGIQALNMAISVSTVLVIFFLLRQPDANTLSKAFLPLNYPRLQKTVATLLHQKRNLFKYRPFVEESRPIIPYIKQKLL